MEIKKYILITDLEVYKLARELSKNGDQFIEATDSVGANIAEGYGRFHYLDRIKFYYNARASLVEANDHWIELLKERNKIKQTLYDKYKEIAKILSIKLNNFISTTYKSKSNENK